jgi:hypothetical protein
MGSEAGGAVLEESQNECFAEHGYFLSQLDGLESLRSSYQRLPKDPYVDGDFRYRRLSRFIAPEQKLRALPHREFLQTDSYNHLLGNIRREYDELEASVAMSDAFIHMLSEIKKGLNLDLSSSVLGVHQIRIVAQKNSSGHPAPEGIHKDGFDYIAIICMDRFHVSGGVTELYEDPNGSPIFSKVLRPGEILFCNDRSRFHFTGPLEPMGTEFGHRDVFVVTIKTGERLS